MNFYSTQAAAEHLAKQIGETVDYWMTRLANMRNPKRQVSYRLNFAKTEGRLGLYAEKDVHAFVEFEKTRRIGDVTLSPRAAEALRAFGVGEAGGGTRGRAFSGSSNLQPAEDGHPPVVQLIVNTPLMVFALSPAQALELGQELIDNANAAKRIYGPAVGDF
jgi:hypothetical protein